MSGCTQYLQNNMIGADVCGLSDKELAEAGMARSSVTGAPQAQGQGAGRGRQGISITCPDGTVITAQQDIEGQGGGGVSP